MEHDAGSGMELDLICFWREACARCGIQTGNSKLHADGCLIVGDISKRRL